MKTVLFPFTVLLVLCALSSACSTPLRGPVTPERIRAVHEAALALDTHVDTPMRLADGDFDPGIRHDPRARGGGKVDFPRMKEGGLDAVFFAVFVGQGPRTPEGNARARSQALAVFDAIERALRAHPGQAEPAFTPEDAERIAREGKRAVFIGMENGYPVGRDPAAVRAFYARGARYITLCHTKNNDLCDASTDEAEHHGLSDLGRRVVAEMNRLGMMVDVSHVSDEAFYDVLACSKAPVIASHSCARAICDHPRNLSDDMLRALASKGGVVQVCMVSDYVKTPEPNPEREAARKALREKYGSFSGLSPEKRKEAMAAWEALNRKHPRRLATVSDFVDHIDHIVKVAGIDHVGIGTDFDGGGGLSDCYDVSELPNITAELLRRGYAEEAIRKIWGGNLMRVFREVRAAAQRLRGEGEHS